jgi:hypothetical protein
VVARALFIVAALGAVLGSSGCEPELVGRPSLIDKPRVLAIRSTPAEAKPDGVTPILFEALYASADPASDTAGLDWAFCTAQKPLAIIGPAAPACLARAGRSLQPIGTDRLASGAMPADACSLFGPSPPQPKPGEPPSRAADPDTTGGYYQPVRVVVPTDSGDEFVVGVTRLDCGLGGATQDQALDFADRYRPNENPVIDSLLLRHPDGKEEAFPSDPMAAPLRVSSGERVTLRASWASCPVKPVCGDGICGAGEYGEANPSKHVAACGDCQIPPLVSKGCTGSEPYVELDPEKRAIVDRREAIRLSWFATGGDFDHDRTGRAEDDRVPPTSENGWTAPARAGDVRLWVVIRDDRGGVGWSEVHVDVRP